MKNAKKLLLNFPKIDFHNIDLVLDSGENRHVVFEKRAGVTRFKIPEELSESILKILPKEFQPYVFCINLSHIQSAVPHYHTYDESVINHYLDTEEYETTFYERIRESDESQDMLFPKERLIRTVSLSSIIPIEKFTAKTGETYILNSKSIHSVSQKDNNFLNYDKFRPIKEEKRIAIQIWTKCPFDLAKSIFS